MRQIELHVGFFSKIGEDITPGVNDWTFSLIHEIRWSFWPHRFSTLLESPLVVSLLIA